MIANNAKGPKTTSDSVNVATKRINVVWPAFLPVVGAKESAMRWLRSQAKEWPGAATYLKSHHVKCVVLGQSDD